MTRGKRTVYSVRRARKNLLGAIRAEIWSNQNLSTAHAHHVIVLHRERAIRDLIASVRAEKRK